MSGPGPSDDVRAQDARRADGPGKNRDGETMYGKNDLGATLRPVAPCHSFIDAFPPWRDFSVRDADDHPMPAAGDRESDR